MYNKKIIYQYMVPLRPPNCNGCKTGVHVAPLPNFKLIFLCPSAKKFPTNEFVVDLCVELTYMTAL